MIVYGDQERWSTVAEECARIVAARASLTGAGLDWHGALARLLLEVAGLLQGIADLEMEQAGGRDTGSPRQGGLMRTLITLAGALDRSWQSGFADQSLPPLDLCAATDEPICVRRPEGFAFYALYPELHAAAARVLEPGTQVIGLRSIGTALAPIVAAAAGSDAAATLRPVGHPFGRAPAVGETLATKITTGAVAIVDEGPGLSGSSILGTVDWLEERGVGLDHIAVLPSHAGSPGHAASEHGRARWSRLRRYVASFDDVVLEGRNPLASWFQDLTGPPLAPLEDVAGGRWRRHVGRPDLPAHPGREALKWRLVAAGGTFRIKFIGLDAAGVAAGERARFLAERGLTVAPLALRYGMLLERWIDDAMFGLPPARNLDLLTRYLRARANMPPPTHAGASLRTLSKMARFNLATVVGEEAAAALLAPWGDDRLGRLQATVRPIHVDGRLHDWEWLQVGGRVLKTDAIDHSQAHDLVGPQDVAWDVAGAAIEHHLDDAQADALAAALGTSAELVAFCRLAYLAFQLGWWSETDDPQGREQARRYAALAREMAEQR
ncbi:hypothetical protein GGR88_000528 [Sphingomonas jejuensis]|uniref:Aminoglycoside phosphotransferase domain-containing protein n=1 Tax=Sphingomonas jejuensis TaxID=904715 RepID=A0ABX0XJN3_9SPHN|nr:hypothetical protein [Sphingomonas jejuensis]NJC33054.1 hypothetical protein [Sphingomonas jejuensis]